MAYDFNSVARHYYQSITIHDNEMMQTHTLSSPTKQPTLAVPKAIKQLRIKVEVSKVEALDAPCLEAHANLHNRTQKNSLK